MAVEGLPNPNDADLNWFKAGGRGTGFRLAAVIVLWCGALIFALLVSVYIFHHAYGGSTDTAELQQQLLNLGEPWSESLAGSLEGYRHWLFNHGTAAELDIFNDISNALTRSSLSVSLSPRESLFAHLYVSAHAGIIRALFLILASARLCLAGILVAVYFGLNSYRPYRADDLLGQTGNGRLFYSGARGGLDRITSTGAPDVLVRGLACPQYASKAETHASPLWQVIKKWDIANGTTEALCAIITRHGQTASYIPRPEDENVFAATFLGDSLCPHAAHLLDAVLRLHTLYGSGDLETPPSGMRSPSKLTGVSSREYAEAIIGALHQVLTPALRAEIGNLDASEVATMVLALESGKVLAHSLEGGKWFRRSNFPHLSARAILHSVVNYPREYSFDARQRIRHALVYASRTSSFAPVQMPIGMTSDAWALRQWAEILLAAPHELAHSVDEVELVGLVRAAHSSWQHEVLPKAMTIVPDLTTTCYTTMSDIFFLPLRSIVSLLRKTVEARDLARIAYLSAIVGARQKVRIEKAQQEEEGGASILIYDRAFTPIPDAEITVLAALHKLDADMIREWSAMRNILASSGWLARRVGDYTVPESSVIFSTFKAPAGYPGANELGLVGKSGLVPLRGSGFRTQWGSDWERRFQSFASATMSETQEDFDKAMQGIKESVVDDPISPSPVTA